MAESFAQSTVRPVQLFPLRCWLNRVSFQLLPAHFCYLQEEVLLPPDRGLFRPVISVGGPNFAIARSVLPWVGKSSRTLAHRMNQRDSDASSTGFISVDLTHHDRLASS